jgi:hypothetical protein
LEKLLDLDRVERNDLRDVEIVDPIDKSKPATTVSTMPVLVEVVPTENGPPVLTTAALQPQLVGMAH